MPFDESMFESNELMQTYWDRSTQERESSTVDYRAERHDEFDELRHLSETTFDSVVVGQQQQQPKVDAIVEPLEAPPTVVQVNQSLDSNDPVVKPLMADPAPANDNTGVIVLVSVLVFILIIYLLSQANSVRY